MKIDRARLCPKKREDEERHRPRLVLTTRIYHDNMSENTRKPNEGDAHQGRKHINTTIKCTPWYLSYL